MYIVYMHSFYLFRTGNLARNIDLFEVLYYYNCIKLCKDNKEKTIIRTHDLEK